MCVSWWCVVVGVAVIVIVVGVDVEVFLLAVGKHLIEQLNQHLSMTRLSVAAVARQTLATKWSEQMEEVCAAMHPLYVVAQGGGFVAQIHIRWVKHERNGFHFTCGRCIACRRWRNAVGLLPCQNWLRQVHHVG